MELSPEDVLDLPRQAAVSILEKVFSDLRQARLAAVCSPLTFLLDHILIINCCTREISTAGSTPSPLDLEVTSFQAEARGVRRQHKVLTGKGDASKACI